MKGFSLFRISKFPQIFANAFDWIGLTHADAKKTGGPSLRTVRGQRGTGTGLTAY